MVFTGLEAHIRPINLSDPTMPFRNLAEADSLLD